MIKAFVGQALAEDIGRGDLFSLLGSDSHATAIIVCKDEGIFAGQVYALALCELNDLKIDFNVKDGDQLLRGQNIAVMEGSAKALLRCERVLLNMLQHASGIATNVAQYVKIIEGHKTKLLDTRKTRPLLRLFEKYAVRCGGGSNHRLGLDDCLMLKDTHLKTIDDLQCFMDEARAKLPFTCKIEIESEDSTFAKKAMQCGADIVMCDNMSCEEIAEVVAYKNEYHPHVLLEASGNITKENIKDYAQTNVDAISSGSLIHQARWLDFSMKITHKRDQ